MSLMEGGADPEKANIFGATALSMASAAGETEIVKYLIRSGVIVDLSRCHCYIFYVLLKHIENRPKLVCFKAEKNIFLFFETH